MSPSRLVILTPTYDDWAALHLLLVALDDVMAAAGRTARVVVVDDASTTPPPDALLDQSLRALSVERLILRRNVGHQRAIAIGLCHLSVEGQADVVVVMDGDGEDRPADVLRLLDAVEQHGGQAVVFAERLRRSEGVVFTVGYHGYRVVHWWLTGVKVRMGNFSAVPKAVLDRLVVVSEIWNHYTAGVLKARLPYRTLPTTRGTRLAGRSTMNVASLVQHGLSAMSVFSDRIGIRLMLATSALALLVVAAIFVVAGVRFGTTLAVPGWATNTIGIALVLLSQLLMLLLVFVFMVLSARSGPGILLLRDYAFYILRVESLRRGGPPSP